MPSGLGADSEEPFVFSAPGEDSEDEADGTDETEERQAEDEDSTSGEQLFE